MLFRDVFGSVFSRKNYLWMAACFVTFLVQFSAKIIFMMAVCFVTFLAQFSHSKIMQIDGV